MSFLPETSAFVLPLAMFAFVSSVTPGPNNVMLTASGATFGYRRTVPHMLGISLGVVAMLLLVGLGLGAAFEREPRLYTLLKYLGAAYLLWLAWKIARSGQVDAGQAGARPFGFWQAAAFQWVNPKAWIMALGAIATYLPSEPTVAAVALLALVFTLVNLPCVSVWTVFGVGLQRFLTKPSYVHAFNITMALMLVLSLYPLVRP